NLYHQEPPVHLPWLLLPLALLLCATQSNVAIHPLKSDSPLNQLCFVSSVLLSYYLRCWWDGEPVGSYKPYKFLVNHFSKLFPIKISLKNKARCFYKIVVCLLWLFTHWSPRELGF